MRTLAIDIETYSGVDIKKGGIYPYAEAEDFEILLFAYAFDDDPVRVIDLAQGEALPGEVQEALTDPDVLKTAYNAAFERRCIAQWLGIVLPVEQWECTMVKAAMLGLPFGLDAVGKVLQLEQGKMSEGKLLIRYFCVPCKPTRTNGGRTRNLPLHDPARWELFKKYCARDVEVERTIRQKIGFFQIPEDEKRLWQLDQRINDRGVLLDMQMVQNALEMDARSRERLTDEAVELTGLDNPNSVAQLKGWLEEETGQELGSLSKAALADMLQGDHKEEVLRVLRLRQELGKTSVKKYQAMQEAVCADGRVHGLLQFYGANRTGRWAGRLVQVQNLPQNHLADLDLARSLVREGDTETLELLYGNVPDTLSQLIRTAFIAKEGHTFVVADFSAIEARVIAWLADERWRLDVFRTHGKIYEASASAMFHVPIEEITKGNPLRQKGKIAELALGYQGGPGALITMGALRMGLDEGELPELVAKWRKANPAIVRLWYEVDRAATEAVEAGGPVTIRHRVRFSVDRGILWITLPSGRKLAYMRPRITQNRFGGKSISYEGMDQSSKQWRRTETYGGKLVENIVQGIARDCLATAMIRLDEMGYDIVMHVHDEVILEVPVNRADALEEACAMMGEPIIWAPGLPLRADGYVTPYYKKD